MSLFGSLLGDLEDDPIFGQHMRSMRQMSSMMNSMFQNDPFNMFGMSPFGAIGGFDGSSALTGARQPQRNLMPFGIPSMPNMNRLLNNEESGASFSSSRVVTMTHGPDGRPQVYQATSSTKTGPGGVRETQRTVQDSRSGVKKMAIGHHIGERGHVIERERNLYSGQQEERQDFINLDEDDAVEFDREFQQRSRRGGVSITNGSERRQNSMPAIMPAPNATTTTTVNSEPLLSTNQQQQHHQQQQQQQQQQPIPKPMTSRRAMRNATTRRPLRTPTSSPLAMPNANIYARPTTSVHPHPYNPASRRAHRQMKGKTQYQPQHSVEIEEIGSEPYIPENNAN